MSDALIYEKEGCHSDSLIDFKEYEIPNPGDVVDVDYSVTGLSGSFIVLRMDYQKNPDQPTLITGINIRKGIKSIEQFHVSLVKKLTRRDDDKFSDWEHYKDSMIEMLRPAIGKTAIVRPFWVRNLSTLEWTKFKVVDIIEREKEEPLIVVRPTKHFSGKYKKYSLSFIYFS